ncbi:MAG TPA: TIM barrel protein [Bacteroidota bacterium]|nr:TIM barrel protein [Bacteroidota bacterium]
MNFIFTLLIAGLMTSTPAASQAPGRPAAGAVFAKNNIVAWCIVPFDVKKRGPEERARMLDRLGITRFAYDWRDEHVSSFDAEMDVLPKHHIALSAFWLPYGPDPTSSVHYATILSLLKRHHLRTQLWWSYGSSDDGLKDLTQDQKVARVAAVVRRLADDAAAIGCTVGLYNHGGWFGEPENELSILDAVRRSNVGIVYNFNHAEEQTDRFRAFFPKILPHLIAVNIAGLRRGDPGRVVAVGEGDSEREMIRQIGESAYDGPLGIINENTDPDAEQGLLKNMKGLRGILTELGYTAALRTYR